MHIIHSSTVFIISDSAEILKLVSPLACPTHDQYAFAENMLLFLQKNTLQACEILYYHFFFLSLQTSPLVLVILNIDA